MKRFVPAKIFALFLAASLALAGVANALTPSTFWPGWTANDTATPTQLTYLLALFQFGLATGAPAHVSSAQTTAPALTSCGTSPTDVGATDTAGTVTMGTSSPTGCVITFNVAYTGLPHCVVTSRSQLASFAYTVSATAITTTQTGTSSNLIDYVCVALAGG